MLSGKSPSIANMDSIPPREPLLIGNTAELYQNLKRHPSSREEEAVSLTRSQSNCFKSAHWSPDGTTLLTSSADNVLRFIVLPYDLLAPPHPHIIKPYSSHTCPEPVYASTFHPSYSLADPSTCLAIAAIRSLPLRLISAFAPDILASYPLVSPTTEAYITPNSLLFSLENTNHFFAGSESCISLFDINRNGEGPMSTMRTTPSRRNHNNASGQGMKGIISALAMSSEGILAAGTFNRWVGLYDSYGRGDTVGVFPLGAEDEPEGEAEKGITQLIWSACGRYLCIAERGSDGISVWDIRGTGKKLAWLQGRKARTQQRLGVDVIAGEIWAGGTDGIVRMWEGLGMKEGVVEPKWSFQAHEAAVSSAVLHPTGSVLATCSGQRHWESSPDQGWQDSDSDSDSVSNTSSVSSVTSKSSFDSSSQNRSSQISDNSLKIWAL